MTSTKWKGFGGQQAVQKTNNSVILWAVSKMDYFNKVQMLGREATYYHTWQQLEAMIYCPFAHNFVSSGARKPHIHIKLMALMLLRISSEKVLRLRSLCSLRSLYRCKS